MMQRLPVKHLSSPHVPDHSKVMGVRNKTAQNCIFRRFETSQPTWGNSCGNCGVGTSSVSFAK